MERNGNNGHNGNGKTIKPPHFASKLHATIPDGRKGKHNLIVSMILDDLDKLELELSVQVPLTARKTTG